MLTGDNGNKVITMMMRTDDDDDDDDDDGDNAVAGKDVYKV